MWYDMKVDAVNAIIDCLECEYDGYYCDLHNEVFNTDYYVTGTAEAKDVLGEDVFDAIGRIYTYERDTLGEVFTDLSDPVKIVNMLYYIIGEETMYDNDEFNKIINEHWNERADEETNMELIKVLKKFRNFLKTSYK